MRVYLDRPWYSSGDGELLGIVLYNGSFPVDREGWKPYVTQWGLDPIWDGQSSLACARKLEFPLEPGRGNRP